jgi:hypothetical protein
MYGSPPYQMYGMLPHHMTNHMMPVPPTFAPPAPAMQTMYSRGEVSHSFDCPVDREVLKNAIQGSTANGIYQETTVFGRSLMTSSLPKHTQTHHHEHNKGEGTTTD